MWPKVLTVAVLAAVTTLALYRGERRQGLARLRRSIRIAAPLSAVQACLEAPGLRPPGQRENYSCPSPEGEPEGTICLRWDLVGARGVSAEFWALTPAGPEATVVTAEFLPDVPDFLAWLAWKVSGEARCDAALRQELARLVHTLTPEVKKWREVAQ